MADKVEIITPPNLLKNKVSEGGAGAVDLEALDRAEKVITDLTGDYLEWVSTDLGCLGEFLNKLTAAAPADRKPVLDEIFHISHDMKGQGGSFGYPLITAIANDLCRLIEKAEGEIGAPLIGAVKIHVDSMKLVIAQRMTGEGSKEAEAILAGLKQVTDKLIAKA